MLALIYTYIDRALGTRSIVCIYVLKNLIVQADNKQIVRLY